MEILLKGEVTIERCETVQDVLQVWPFLTEGLAHINRLFKNAKRINEAEFLKTVLGVIDQGKPNGLVGVAYDCKHRPVAYGVVFNNSCQHKHKSAVVYAAFSTESGRDAIMTLLRETEEWGREYGYKEIQAFSPRFSGAGFALFEKRYGFVRSLVLFTKEL